MKRAIVIILSSVLFLFLLSFFLPAHVVRYFTWNYADLGDGEKFDNLPVKMGEDPYYFSYSTNAHFPVLPSSYQHEERFESFDQFLEKKEAVAFLIIRNDTILYENYFAGYEDTSLVPVFSIAKSYVSALTGIAMDEGYIYTPSQSITFFLKELPQEFDRITIEDLLNMRSGIRYSEKYNTPFSDAAKYYYGTDLQKYITKLSIRQAPDQTYDYISVNALLLGMIVERATNTKLNIYLQNKIWKPLGMESDASWSIDSYEHQVIKANCCINSTARDIAKFGRLYLNGGNWDGTQIIPQKWVHRSTSIINDSRDDQGYPYTYMWRVLENGSFFAKGILGQYLFIDPEKKLIFVRLGKKYADIDWAALCNELADQY